MSRAKQRKLETDELTPTYAAREMAKCMPKHQMSDEGMAPRIASAYPMPKDREDLVVQRVVVKEDLSRVLAERLLENLRRVVHYFEQQTGYHPKKEGSHFHH